MIAVGDIVRVAQVIDVNGPNSDRTTSKRALIGQYRRVTAVGSVVNGHIPYFVGTGYYFTDKEVELVCVPNTVPQIGSFVRVFEPLSATGKIVQVHRICSLRIADAQETSFDVIELLTEKENEEHKKSLAAEKKAELVKKQNDMVAAAQKMLQDASKIAAEIEQMN